MANIDFYEKPGCVNNTRQKQLLSEAGHELQVFNLLTYPWAATPEKLRAFLGQLPVAEWFNRSAPAVKNGEIVPETLNEQQALALLIAQPLLIRRPLMEVNGVHLVGFDLAVLSHTLALKVANTEADLETCPKTQTQSACLS